MNVIHPLGAVLPGETAKVHKIDALWKALFRGRQL